MVVDGCFNVFGKLIDGLILWIVASNVIALLDECSDVFWEDSVVLRFLSALGNMFVVSLNDECCDMVVCCMDVSELFCVDVMFNVVCESLPVGFFEVGESVSVVFCAEVRKCVDGDDDRKVV